MSQGSAVPTRPKSGAKLLDCEDDTSTSKLIFSVDDDDSASSQWLPVAACLAHFDCDTWLQVMRQLIHHPERNSSNILRADIIQEETSVAAESAYQSATTIWRRILPRRPNIDADLLQKCSILQDREIDPHDALVLLVPLGEDGGRCTLDDIPFYHPKVRAIAFRYCSRNGFSTGSEGDDAQETIFGDIALYILPFRCDASFNAVKQPAHRLSRTALSLIETQAQHSWGTRHKYQKRVMHDTLVPREAYMDLYIKLKDKYANLIITSWVEKTDPAKHVFEDLGIAAFLILLWEETFKSTGSRLTRFVDVGCGNGLLVYLLNAEGYIGFGFDLQERKSWEVWRNLPGGADLRKISLDAPRLEEADADLFPPGCFLVGNHADELTSWLPILAHTTKDCYGFANIPCCLYNLDGQSFNKTKYSLDEGALIELLGQGKESATLTRTQDEFDRGPPVQVKGSASTRNVAYLRYVSHLHLQAGWHLEKEALRIPSTKNWALVGRRRTWQIHPCESDKTSSEAPDNLRREVEERVLDLIAQNAPRWKARLPPGKANRTSSH